MKISGDFVRQGCISSITCKSCGIQLICNSSLPSKVGTYNDDKTIRYIGGPCCCGLMTCSHCGKYIGGGEFPKLHLNRYVDFPIQLHGDLVWGPYEEDYQI